MSKLKQNINLMYKQLNALSKYLNFIKLPKQ